MDSRHLLMQTVFEEWSLADLVQAIAQTQHLVGTRRVQALEGLLVSTEHMTQEERSAIARRLGNEWLAIERIENEIGSELFNAPESEWKAFVRDNDNSMQSHNEPLSKMLVFNASAWIEKDGVEVFEKIREAFPSQHPLLETISSVVEELFQRDPRVALELAANVEGIGSGQRANISSEVLTRWAESAPKDAIETVNGIEARYLRRELQGIVFETWAATDADSLLRSIPSLPADMQIVARERALIAIARTSPSDAVEMLNDIPDRHSHNTVAETTAVHWARHDVFGAFNWISGDEQLASMQVSLQRQCSRSFAHTDPQLAFETSLTYPPGADGKGMEVFVITTLPFGGDLDRAISLLPQTRKGETRNHAYESKFYSLLLEDDTMRANDAMDLFVQASKTESVKNIEFMLMNLSWKAPLVLFNSLDELPSQELRRDAARELLVHNESSGVFTEDELAEIRERKESLLIPI